jgi:hypothetical protein
MSKKPLLESGNSSIAVLIVQDCLRCGFAYLKLPSFPVSLRQVLQCAFAARQSGRAWELVKQHGVHSAVADAKVRLPCSTLTDLLRKKRPAKLSQLCE